MWEDATDNQVTYIQHDLREYDSCRALRTEMLSKQEASDIIQLDDEAEKVRLVEAKIHQWKLDKLAMGVSYK